MQLQRGEQQALALRGTAGNGSFHEKKLPRQKARQKLRVWQGVWLLPGSKPQAKCLFLQHLQPPGPPWVLLSRWELRSSERSRHSHIQEPLSCRLHVHTQARKEPAGSLAAPSTPGRALSAQGPLTLPLPNTSGSVLALPVSRTYGEVGLPVYQ